MEMTPGTRHTLKKMCFDRRRRPEKCWKIKETQLGQEPFIRELAIKK
jgi:hypothetical protein